jgi:hypothetical protein
VVGVPLGGSDPLQLPAALQDVAFVDDHVSVALCPAGIMGWLNDIFKFKESPPCAAFTANIVFPKIELEVAVIVVEPAATPVARPAALIVATVVLEEVQAAVEVKSFVLPSL